MILNESHCEGCPLDGTPKVAPMGNIRDGAFFFVVDGPGETSTRCMPPKALRLMEKNLDANGFSKTDCYITSAIKCPHDKDKFTTKQRREIQAHCVNHLNDEIQIAKPEVILPMGATPASMVEGRAVKITKVKGVPYRKEGRDSIILPLMNPNQAVLYQQHEPTFAADFATLARLVDHGYDIEQASKSVMGDYEYVDDLQFLIDQKPKLVAFDTETTSLRWFEPHAQILTMQFCIEEGKAYTLSWDHPDHPRSMREKQRLRRQITELLCRDNVKVVGHNLKFDCIMLYKKAGIRFKIGGDTLMLMALLDENSYNKNLADTIKRFVPDMAGYSDRFDREVDKSRMRDLPLDARFLDYSAGDADAAFRLHKALYAEVAKDRKLLTHYNNISLPGNNAFVSMEARGLFIDESAISEFEQVMRDSVAEQYAALMKQVPRSIKRAHIDKGLKFSRPQFLLDILFYHPDGFRLRPMVYTKTTQKLSPDRRVPSVSSKDHLPYFFEKCPFTQQLAEYIKDERLLGTNVVRFKDKYIVDGKVRPTYRLDKTVTGRTSSEDPNGQNYPKRGKKAKAYRKMFIPPPGHFVIEADLSQAELRISADMANEPTMLRIYNEGGDIHIESALIAMGITRAKFNQLPPDEQKLARTKAKAINFGFIYGMGWRKFIGYAKTQYGVEFTEREAQNIRNAFFAKYHVLPKWHNATRDYVRQHKQVRSYSGRVRHLPMVDSDEDMIRGEAERQAINSPVQEFSSSLGVMAIARMEEEIDPQYLQIVGFVHDSVIAYAPKEYLDWAAKRMKHYMQSNPLNEVFGVRLRVPIISDVSFGENLGEVHELPGFVLDKPYDYGTLRDKDGNLLIRVPRQKTPPNDGRLTQSIYSQPVSLARH